MKTRPILLTLALCFVTALAFANPNMGTWKLNEAKSKIPQGSRRTTRSYTLPQAIT